MKQFLKQHSYHILILIILIIITAISGYLAFSNPKETGSQELEQIQSPSSNQAKQIETENIAETAINNTEQEADFNQLDSSENEPSKSSPEANIEVEKNEVEESEYSQENEKTIPDSENTIPAVLTVEGKKYETSIPRHTSVYEFMQKLSQESDFTFSGKEYTGLGFFVEEINGIKNDNIKGKYWIYYINGESAQVGISNYIINSNDLIEWKYENANL